MSDQFIVRSLCNAWALLPKSFTDACRCGYAHRILPECLSQKWTGSFSPLKTVGYISIFTVREQMSPNRHLRFSPNGDVIPCHRAQVVDRGPPLLQCILLPVVSNTASGHSHSHVLGEGAQAPSAKNGRGLSARHSNEGTVAPFPFHTPKLIYQNHFDIWPLPSYLTHLELNVSFNSVPYAPSLSCCACYPHNLLCQAASLFPCTSTMINIPVLPAVQPPALHFLRAHKHWYI